MITMELALTPREREVMAKIADGLTTDETAEALEISAHTVRTHVKNACRKNNAPTKLRLAVLIEREGWVVASAN